MTVAPAVYSHFCNKSMCVIWHRQETPKLLNTLTDMHSLVLQPPSTVLFCSGSQSHQTISCLMCKLTHCQVFFMHIDQNVYSFYKHQWLRKYGNWFSHTDTSSRTACMLAYKDNVIVLDRSSVLFNPQALACLFPVQISKLHSHLTHCLIQFNVPLPCPLARVCVFAGAAACER